MLRIFIGDSFNIYLEFFSKSFPPFNRFFRHSPQKLTSLVLYRSAYVILVEQLIYYGEFDSSSFFRCRLRQMITANAPIAHAQKTGHRSSESPMPRNETIVPPMRASPTISNAFDNLLKIKQINDLIIYIQYGQVPISCVSHDDCFYGNCILFTTRWKYT